MKRILAVLVMLISISIANAQQRGQGQGPRGGNPEERAKARTERLVKQLNLTEEQKASVHEAFLEQSKQQQELFSQGGEGDREQARKKMRTLSQETNAKVISILDNEQKAKYEQIQAERQKRAAEKRGKGGQRPNRDSGTNQ